MCLQCAGVTSPDCPSDLASDGLSFESIESCRAVGGDGCESISALQQALQVLSPFSRTDFRDPLLFLALGDALFYTSDLHELY